MKALLINTCSPCCGVHQYGKNLASVLTRNFDRVHWEYYQPSSFSELEHIYYDELPDVILYNWQSGVGGFLAQAPFREWKSKQVLVYHDLPTPESSWDAILFSDPTMVAHDNWHPIGRPLPQLSYAWPTPNNKILTVGAYGLVGAWADRVVSRVVDEFEFAHIRLLLPFATYGDAEGATARAMADRCRALIHGKYVTLEISHVFLSQPDLLLWLSQNDINVFIRDPAAGWRGISSAPDCALAVRRPLAVNRTSCFRHLHGLEPSICVEDRSIAQILETGLSPLVPLYQAWDAVTVRGQVEDVITGLV